AGDLDHQFGLPIAVCVGSEQCVTAAADQKHFAGGVAEARDLGEGLVAGQRCIRIDCREIDDVGVVQVSDDVPLSAGRVGCGEIDERVRAGVASENVG